MTGRGSPVALHFNFKVPPTTARTLAGGLTVNRGGETTTKSMFFSTRPNRFDAAQKKKSESPLRTCNICNALLLYFTLPWGNGPDDFLHETTGAGYPVT